MWCLMLCRGVQLNQLPQNCIEVIKGKTPEGAISLDTYLRNVDNFYKDLREKICKDPNAFPQWIVKDDYV